MSFGAFFPFDASMSAMTLPSVARARSTASHQVLTFDEHHEDEEKKHSKQAIFARMESGEGVKTADFRPREYTTKPTYYERQKTEFVHHISKPGAHQDETQVQNLERREDLNDDTGIVRLEKHGITVRIPTNEAYRAKDVIIEPIHDIPPELVLKETEAIISVGLRMLPCGANFDIPVRVTMPHCGIFTKPEAADVVTYYRKSASDGFTAIPSTSESLRCVVRHRDLDLYMNHFSELWIVAIIRSTFIGKRVICTPYIPVSTPKNDEHVLFVHVRDENVTKEKVPPRYMAPIPGERFLVRWRHGGLQITCPESTMKDKAMTLHEKEIRHLTNCKVIFTVDTRKADKNKMILQFILKQSTTRRLLVPMYLQDATEASPDKSDYVSPRPSASTSIEIPSKEASAATGEISTSKARVLSIDEQHEDEDKYPCKGIFDQTGGELHIPSYGLTLTIPPGALPDGSNETITLDVLTDVPPKITLRHDETLVTYGFQCLPSGLQFVSEKPVRLKMPHCANLIDPTNVQVVLYSMNHEGTVDRIVQTSITCRVTHSHVEISLEHFSKGFAAFTNAKYKRMSFMPFLPRIMPEGRKMTLRFRMVNKPDRMHWENAHKVRENAEYQPAKDDDDEMNVKHKDMEVTCQLSDNGMLRQNIDASFFKVTKRTLYFQLDFNGKDDDLLVKLNVKQSNRSMDIKFRTHYLAHHEGEVHRIVQTSRTCLGTVSHMEISQEHLSKGSKRMSFVPFLPEIMPQCRKILLQFRMVTKPLNIDWEDIHEIREKAEYRPAKDDDDEMNVKHKDMEVTCQLNDNDTLTQNIDASFIKEIKHALYFELDIIGKTDDLLVKLKVIQSKRQMNVEFRTHYLASRGIIATPPGKPDSTSPGASASTSVDTPPQGTTAVSEVSTSTARKVSSAMLNILARYIPSYAYIQFSEQLGIEHNQAKNIVVKYSSDYEKATRECIGIWMNRSDRSVADLHDVLRKVELGGLIGYCNQQQ